MRRILFVQGAGEGVYDRWDNHLVDSLREELGAGYEIRYPAMPNEDARFREILRTGEALTSSTPLKSLRSRVPWRAPATPARQPQRRPRPPPIPTGRTRGSRHARCC